MKQQVTLGVVTVTTALIALGLAIPAFAQEKTFTSVIQSKITERREMIREKLGVDARTPLSDEALLVIDQITSKLDIAKSALSDMNSYISALQAAYLSVDQIESKVAYADLDTKLSQMIEAVYGYRKNAAKETVSEFSNMVQDTKNIITEMTTLQMQEIETLRAANVPAQLLSFEACSFSAVKDGLFIADDSGSIDVSFAEKPLSSCATPWVSQGTLFGSVHLESLSGVVVVGTSSPLVKTFDGSIHVSVPRLATEPVMVLVVEDQKETPANTFVIPIVNSKGSRAR